MGTIGKGEQEDSHRRKKPPAVVLARAAAYIDGEGCISIGRATRPSNRSAYFLHVLVDNTDPRLPYWFQGQFGGRIHELPLTPHNHKNKRLRYRWEIRAHHRWRFLHWIRPYVILKGEQIDVAIRFLAYQRHEREAQQGKPGGGLHCYSDAYLIHADECFTKLRELRTDRFLRSVHPQRLTEAAPNTSGM